MFVALFATVCARQAGAQTASDGRIDDRLPSARIVQTIRSGRLGKELELSKPDEQVVALPRIATRPMTLRELAVIERKADAERAIKTKRTIADQD